MGETEEEEEEEEEERRRNFTIVFSPRHKGYEKKFDCSFSPSSSRSFLFQSQFIKSFVPYKKEQEIPPFRF